MGTFFSFSPLICRYLRGSLIPCFYSIYHIQPGGAVFLSLIQCEQIMHHIQHATLLYHKPDPHLVWVQKTSVSYDTARSGFHLMLDIKLCIGGVQFVLRHYIFQSLPIFMPYIIIYILILHTDYLCLLHSIKLPDLQVRNI